jgi:hypothetical protein
MNNVEAWKRPNGCTATASWAYPAITCGEKHLQEGRIDEARRAFAEVVRLDSVAEVH